MSILWQTIFTFFFGIVYSQTDQIYIQNLDEKCFKCMCQAATNCDINYGCQGHFCGPFKISRVYWADAGKVVMLNDTSERSGAFEDCAVNYRCAQQMIRNYMAKYGKDCNNDLVTNCEDFVMIHYNGGLHCYPSLDRHEGGKNYSIRFNYCAPL